MSIVTLIVAFVLGFVAGAFVFAKKKTKVPQDIEESLKKAAVIPSAPPQPTGVEISRKTQADTLEKKLLYEEELSLIFKMGREMFSSVSFESIAKSMAESANKIVNAEICTVLLKDKASGELFPIYSQGVKEEYLEKMRFKKDESISGWVVENNEILVKNDIVNDSWFRTQNKGEYFVSSLLSIPLSTNEGVIGLLNLSHKKSQQPFTEDEIEFLKGLTTEAAIAMQNATLYEQVQESYLKTITALAFALDARDAYTREHSENVTKYAVAIAQEMKLNPLEIEHIRRAGLLHDIGKIGIRDGVLLKPSKLSEDEYNDIKRHPAKGEAIVNALPFLKEEAEMIRHHHERYDGTGYPDGVAGPSIEKGARILAVADSFDAMVENRIYRKALNLDTARQELKNNRAKQFDPEVADALLRILENNPGFLESELR